MNRVSAHLLPVLRQLSSDYFLSGEQIARQLGCSRATVHNAIRAALEIGFSVHAVHGRGYRLPAPVSWLDASRLAEHFAASGIAMRHYDHLTSTNAVLLDWATGPGDQAWSLADGANDGLNMGSDRAPHRALVTAEWQSGGRGRRGRTWLSGLADGLTFSYLWRSARPAAQLSGLSLAVGVALVKGLRDRGWLDAQVKWPNDIQVGGAKLAGILIELASDRFARDVLAPSTAVIGVGLNVRGGAALARQLGQPVTDLQSHLSSMRAEHASPLDRNALLLHLVRWLDANLERFEEEGFAAFQAEWHACHAHQGCRVSLQINQNEAVIGTALGVDGQGALLLETATGVRAMHSGEVSLRMVSG